MTFARVKKSKTYFTMYLTALHNFQSHLAEIESALAEKNFEKLEAILHEAQGKYQGFVNK
jgi:HPt (histidine-containing phosphotransfer) domain-containing protein